MSFAYSFTQFGILWSDLVVLSLRVDFLGKLSTLLNPFAPGNLAKKNCIEASWAVFWSLSGFKALKRMTKPFTGCLLSNLQIQMQNISLQSWGMQRKQNFKIVFLRLKVTHIAVLTFSFPFLSFTLLLLFLPLLLFPWAFSRLHFEGKSFWENS